MRAKSFNIKEPTPIPSADDTEREALKESTKRAQHTMSVLKSDNARLKGLLEEAVAQLSKTNDEYHSELGDKIRVELGMVKENSLQSA